MIYVGSVLGGPEQAQSRIADAVRKVAGLVGGGSESDLGSLDIVFHVPGSIKEPDFKGVRLGKFSLRARMLMVQVSVPHLAMQSEAPEIFLLEALKEGIRAARPVFRKAKIKYPEEVYLGIANRALDSVRATMGSRSDA